MRVWTDSFLQDRDDSRAWRTIYWKGRYQRDRNVCPTDQGFKYFFEGVLNPIAVDHVGNDVQSVVNIPILDDHKPRGS